MLILNFNLAIFDCTIVKRIIMQIEILFSNIKELLLQLNYHSNGRIFTAVG